MILKIELEVELEENVWGDFNDASEKEWFEKDIMNAETLYLHSNEVGDEVGKITKIVKFEITKPKSK